MRKPDQETTPMEAIDTKVPAPYQPEHYFPSYDESGKYSGDPPYVFTQYTLIYRELIDGDVYRLTHDQPEECLRLDVLNTLRRDIVENTIEEFDIDVVVVPTGGKYGIRKQRAYVLNAPIGPQPYEYEKFYPWSPQEFRELVPKMKSGINPDTPVFGIELVPIIDGLPAYNQRRVIVAGRL